LKHGKCWKKQVVALFCHQTEKAVDENIIFLPFCNAGDAWIYCWPVLVKSMNYDYSWRMVEIWR
jgi:hypothetical protein